MKFHVTGLCIFLYTQNVLFVVIGANKMDVTLLIFFFFFDR